MAMLPQRGDTGFTLGGFLILAALGTFLWKGAPLESVRPSNEQSGWYENQLSRQVPARLWQDPFKAVYAHEQANRSDATPDGFETGRLVDVFEGLRSTTGDVDVSLLLVMVSPGSYAELEERRRRRRYAVLSGLGEEHFVPRNPEILNVFYLPKAKPAEQVTLPSIADASASSNCATGEPQTSNSCYPVPYEWYDYEDTGGNTTDQRQVLVLWLDESQFADTPLKRISNFLEGLLTAKKLQKATVRATVLGPARSDALRNLVTKKTQEETDAFNWLRDRSHLAEFNIISSTATVADADLIGEWSPEVILDESVRSPILKYYPEFSGENCPATGTTTTGKPCMRFLRTIQSDEVLIRKLAAELKQNRNIDSNNDYVVVISEWDTYFGRFLPRAFTKHFCAPICDTVLRYSYQRGMDGIVVGEHNSMDSSQHSGQQKAGGLSPSIDASMVRRPAGTGQFDYLRRLAADISKKDRELRLGTGHGVRAVVLLGSDVYDKLLILRALRQELPGALFATTDLDAQLLHPAEYSWARSLIIASTFDLTLSDNVPMTTMPFRDSYQTSIYLATRLALGSKLLQSVASDCDAGGGDENHSSLQACIYNRIPPQLFEVGRNLVALPDGGNADKTWNRVATHSFALPVSLGLATIAMLAIFAFHQLRPRAGIAVAVLAALLLLFSLLAVIIFSQVQVGEPLNLLDGVSIWPAEYIRLLGVVLSLVFIWSTVHALHRNWNELGVRYFWPGPEPGEDGMTLRQVWKALKTRFRHPIQSIKEITLTQALPVLMILAMLLIMRSVMPRTCPLIEKIPLLIGVWTVLMLFWWATLYSHIWKDIRVLSVNRWASSCTSNRDAVSMWSEYGNYGAGEQRFLRTIAYILMYFTFASIMFAILGSPASPCRGELACNIDKAILGFSVLSMLVLLFLVVDAARLCICWVDSMRHKDVDWSRSKIAEFVQQLKLPELHAQAWMQIHLIGERTCEVTRLIYYPVLVILLLLLARSTYFDNWDFPQALAIVIGMNFVIALSSIVRLNFVAQSVREEILRNLHDEKLAADRIKAVSYEASASERQELIHQLESLRIGAYLRVWDQPPIRATFMLLGGVALTYAEYFSVFLR